jgi:hypothetical protein
MLPDQRPGEGGLPPAAELPAPEGPQSAPGTTCCPPAVPNSDVTPPRSRRRSRSRRPRRATWW